MNDEIEQLRQEILNYGIENLNADIVPVRDTIEVLSTKWKVEVLTSILIGRTRFKDIKAQLPTISDKVLAERLDTMLQEKLISRTEEYGYPPKVSYQVTPLGISLYKVINMMRDWGKEYRATLLGRNNSPNGK